MKDKILTILKDPMTDELKFRFIIIAFNQHIIDKMKEIDNGKKIYGFDEMMSLIIEL